MKKTYDRHDVEVLETSELYQGFFRMEKFKLRHRLFDGGWSQPMEHELFVRGDAVAVILFDQQASTVALLEQFRIGALEEKDGPWCFEIVAGIVGPGETPEAVAHREVQEETGLTLDRLQPITRYLSSPGGTNEKLHIYCGYCDLSQAGGIFGLEDECEDIKVTVLDAAEVFDAMLEGRCNNAATLIGLQWLKLNHFS